MSSPHESKMFLHAGNSTTRDMSLIVDMPVYSQRIVRTHILQCFNPVNIT